MMLRLVTGLSAGVYDGKKNLITTSSNSWMQKQQSFLHHISLAPKAISANHEFGNLEMEKKKEEVQAQVDTWKIAFAYADLAVVKCAIELGIADLLESHGEPMTLSDLSSALGCSESSLYRIMRFLINRKVFNQVRISQDPGSAPAIGYVNSPISQLLTKNGGKSMAGLVMLESSPVMLGPWHALSTRVQSDKNPPFKSTHDKDIWGFNAENPDHSKVVDEAVAGNANLVMPDVVERCREVFEGVETVVDVGGGNGTAMGILVKSCPWIKGINFDLPHVVSVAPDHVGVEHVEGDMFVDVPKADVALLLWVLHDWGNEECIKILKKCKEAISRDKGKVIIIDAVVADDADNSNNGEKDELECVRLMLDMVMLAHTNNGKERTAKEWDYVLTQAGFTTHIIKPIQAIQSVIIAFP